MLNFIFVTSNCLCFPREVVNCVLRFIALQPGRMLMQTSICTSWRNIKYLLQRYRHPANNLPKQCAHFIESFLLQSTGLSTGIGWHSMKMIYWVAVIHWKRYLAHASRKLNERVLKQHRPLYKQECFFPFFTVKVCNRSSFSVQISISALSAGTIRCFMDREGKWVWQCGEFGLARLAAKNRCIF